jgi:hypothetical protein
MLSDGLPNVAVVAMKIHNPSRSLVIGTYGVSMYKLNIDDLVSVDEIANNSQSEIRVFPNPFSDQVSFTGNTIRGIQIEVYSASGKLVMTTNIQSNNAFSELDKGVYFFNFINSSGKIIQSEKVIKL